MKRQALTIDRTARPLCNLLQPISSETGRTLSYRTDQWSKCYRRSFGFAGKKVKTVMNGDMSQDLNSRLSASWIAKNPENLHESALLRQLPFLDPYQHDFLTCSVILITPALAHLFDQDSPFFKSFIAQIYRGFPPSSSSKGISLRSIVAVVDEIPIHGISPDIANRSQATGRSEGLALMLCTQPTKDRVEYNGPAANETDRVATINVLTPIDLGLVGTRYQNSYAQITLPVANTLFTNGRRSTLFQQEWFLTGDVSRPTPTEERLRPLSRRDLNRFDIEGGITALLNLPLKSLTKPRSISTAMGNVIREIAVDGETVPASTELEVAVNSLVKIRRNESSIEAKLHVYALISQSKAPEWKSDRPPEVTAGRDPYNEAYIRRELVYGARLYKVTGGGGGWGKKQGLLSLEPAIDFQSSDTSVQMPSFEDDVDEISLPGKSQALVSPGDTVQFYAAYETEHSESPADKGVPLIQTGFWSAATWTHVAYSTVTVGTTSTTQTPKGIQPVLTRGKPWISLPNCFGFLSEAGAALTIKSTEPTTSYTPISSRKLFNTTAKTRLDVPNVKAQFITAFKTQALTASYRRLKIDPKQRRVAPRDGNNEKKRQTVESDNNT